MLHTTRPHKLGLPIACNLLCKVCQWYRHPNLTAMWDPIKQHDAGKALNSRFAYNTITGHKWHSTVREEHVPMCSGFAHKPCELYPSHAVLPPPAVPAVIPGPVPAGPALPAGTAQPVPVPAAVSQAAQMPYPAQPQAVPAGPVPIPVPVPVPVPVAVAVPVMYPTGASALTFPACGRALKKGACHSRHWQHRPITNCRILT